MGVVFGRFLFVECQDFLRGEGFVVEVQFRNSSDEVSRVFSVDVLLSSKNNVTFFVLYDAVEREISEGFGLFSTVIVDKSVSLSDDEELLETGVSTIFSGFVF